MFKKLKQVFGGDDDSAAAEKKFVDVRFKEKYAEFKDKPHPEMHYLIVTLGASDSGLSAADLKRFLRDVQKVEKVSNEDCTKLIKEHETAVGHESSQKLSVEGLHSLLKSAPQSIFKPENTKPWQDMTQPLSHYYIASSHNTYLWGHQLKGEASSDAYVKALGIGTRLVELDCHDGSDGEPAIYHGKTLTSSVKFSEVIQALKEHSFKMSPYPVIMSFENHCSLPQQAKMAEILKQILGDQLCTSLEPLVKNNLLPSPQDLQHKFLVKGKKVRPELEEASDAEEGEDIEDDEEEDEEEEQGGAAAPTDKAEAKADKPKKLNKIAVALSRVTALQSVHFNDFEAAQQKPWQMSSIPEKRSLKFSDSEDAIKWVNYNKRFLCKVYPYGLRFGSSNMEPMVPWLCGAHIAALNYQTESDPMTVNQAWFGHNGNCGYVLKPEFMRDPKATYNLQDSETFKTNPVEFKIRLLSGINLPQDQLSDIIDPFVTIEIVGIPEDQDTQKTRTIQNTQNPIWDEQKSFNIACPDLAIVMLRVYDKDTVGKDFLGQYFIHAACLQSGYRYIQLEDQSRSPVPGAFLFVHVSVERQGAAAAAK